MVFHLHTSVSQQILREKENLSCQEGCGVQTPAKKPSGWSTTNRRVLRFSCLPAATGGTGNANRFPFLVVPNIHNMSESVLLLAKSCPTGAISHHLGRRISGVLVLLQRVGQRKTGGLLP